MVTVATAGGAEGASLPSVHHEGRSTSSGNAQHATICHWTGRGTGSVMTVVSTARVHRSNVEASRPSRIGTYCRYDVTVTDMRDPDAPTFRMTPLGVSAGSAG